MSGSRAALGCQWRDGDVFTAAFITRAREEVPLLSSTIYTKLEDREVSGAASLFSIMGGGLGVAQQTPA